MSNSQRYIVFVIILLAVVLAYGIIIGNDFTYDDHYSIVENNYLKNLSFAKHLFSKHYFAISEEASYRPLITLLNFIERGLFDINPVGYHAVNLILHACCCLILFAMLRLLTSTHIACIAALLHAVHPVLSESVVSAAFAEDMLCLLFLLCAMYAGIRYFAAKKNAYLWLSASAIGYLCSLASKEMALFYPIFLAVFLVITRQQKSRAAIFFISMVLISVFFCILRFKVFSNPDAAAHTMLNPLPEWITVIYYIPDYLRLYLLPVGLTILHPVKAVPPVSIITTCLYILFFIVLIVLCFRLIKSNKTVGIGFIWFLLALVPVSGIVPLKFPFAERFIYLPTIGLHVIVAQLLCTTLYKVRKKIVVPMLLIFFILLMSNSMIRSADWRSDWTLWHTTAQTSPRSPVTQYMLGSLYQKQGLLEQAKKAYQRSIRLNPDYLSPYINLATVYMDLGQYEYALRINNTILAKSPAMAIAYLNNALIYAAQGDTEKEKIAYLSALQSDPSYIPVYECLTQWYIDHHQSKQAAPLWEQALKYDPYWITAYINLYKYYVDQDSKEKAHAVIQRGLKYNPDNRTLRLLQLKLSN